MSTCLDRLNTLCELYQESYGGEKIRAVAEWTGVADVLPAKSVPLDRPAGQRTFRLQLLATINRECHELRDAIKVSRNRYLPLSLVIEMAAMLRNLIDTETPGDYLESYADEIKEKHGQIMEELWQELPDPEEFDEVHDTLADLMRKYSKKALHGNRLKLAA